MLDVSIGEGLFEAVFKLEPYTRGSQAYREVWEELTERWRRELGAS